MFWFPFLHEISRVFCVWAVCRDVPAAAVGTVSTGISTVAPRPSFGFKQDSKIEGKGLLGQMQNISCPIWHGNASGLAQQELEDEVEENDVPLSLVCCKWGTTLEENGLYGKEIHSIYVHNSSKECLGPNSIIELAIAAMNNGGSLNVQNKAILF